MPKLNVQLGDNRHAEWMDYCKEWGLVAADEVRDFVDSRLKKRTKPRRPKLSRMKERKVDVMLRLTESENEGVRLRTMLNGGNRQKYIIRVIRADLARVPVLEETAALALREHIKAMDAIGRNLNQVARALNRNEMPDRSMQLGQLVSAINEQAEVAQALIDVCYTRCGIDP